MINVDHVMNNYLNFQAEFIKNPKQILKAENVNSQQSELIELISNFAKFINSRQTLKKQNNLKEFHQNYHDKKETEIDSFDDNRHENLQENKKLRKLQKILQKKNEFFLRKRSENCQRPSKYEILAEAKLKQCSNQTNIKFQINLNNQKQKTLVSRDLCIRVDDDKLHKIVELYVVKKEFYQPKLGQKTKKDLIQQYLLF